MIAGFITVIVLIKAPVFDSVLTPVLNCPQSSSRNAWREHGVITPQCATKERQRDRDDRGRGSIRLIFNNNNNINSDDSSSNLKIIYDRVTHN